MSLHPQRKGELVQTATAKGWTVYEPENDSLHVLNETAKAIWELCDGQTSPQEMANAISQLTALTLEQAEHDVGRTLDNLRQIGLVVFK